MTDEEDGIELEFDDEGEFVIGASVSTGDNRADPDEALETLFSMPEAADLVSLTLGTWGDWEIDYSRALELIAEADCLESLEELTIGGPAEEDEQRSWTHIGDIGPLWLHLPSLLTLRLEGGGLELGEPSHDTLEELRIGSNHFNFASAKAFAGGRFPSLKTLHLSFGVVEFGPKHSLENFQRFFDERRYSSLRDLRAESCMFCDDFTSALVKSPIIGGLNTLSLAKGSLSDEGLKTLLGAAPLFKRLKRLDVSESLTTGRAEKRLVAAFPGVHVEVGHRELERDEDYYEDSWE